MYAAEAFDKQIVEHEMHLYWARSRINFQFSGMKYLFMPICNSFNFGRADAYFQLSFRIFYWCFGWYFHHSTVFATTGESQYNNNKNPSSRSLSPFCSHPLALVCQTDHFLYISFVSCRLICYFCKLKNHNFLAFREFSIVFRTFLEAVDVKLTEKKRRVKMQHIRKCYLSLMFAMVFVVRSLSKSKSQKERNGKLNVSRVNERSQTSETSQMYQL